MKNLIAPGSQAFQDIFALQTAKHNTYIEIGAGDPINGNNTYHLEKNGWKGFSIELNSKIFKKWIKEPIFRNNKIYCDNAIELDYIQCLEENNLPTHLGYLSCDIEPVENTFLALKRVIEQGISFDCITFEHDKYQSATDFDPIVKKYLKRTGYSVAVYDVYFQQRQPCYFETWFVHDSINFEKIKFDDWKKEHI